MTLNPLLDMVQSFCDRLYDIDQISSNVVDPKAQLQLLNSTSRGSILLGHDSGRTHLIKFPPPKPTATVEELLRIQQQRAQLLSHESSVLPSIFVDCSVPDDQWSLLVGQEKAVLKPQVRKLVWSRRLE